MGLVLYIGRFQNTVGLIIVSNMPQFWIKCITMGKMLKTTGVMAGAVHKQVTIMQMAEWNDSAEGRGLWK